MKFKHLLLSILISFALVIAPAASGLSFGTGEAAGIAYAAGETETADDDSLQSSFEYKEYRSHTIYRNALMLRMPDVYKKLSPEMDDDETVPIPGTLSARRTDRPSRTIRRTRRAIPPMCPPAPSIKGISTCSTSTECLTNCTSLWKMS